MNERLLEEMLLTFLLASTLVTALGSQRVAASDELPLIYIRGDGSIEPSTVPIQRDDDLYTLTGDITDYDGIVVERNSIILDGANHLFDGGDRDEVYGVTLEGRENVTIRNMIMTDFGFMSACIYLNSSSDNFILANDLFSDFRYGQGLTLDYSSNNVISGNKMRGNSFLTDSSNNLISGNNITGTYYEALILSGSDNRIVGNNIIGNGAGISLRGSNNSIFGNNIANRYWNIELDGSNNSISGNNITGGDLANGIGLSGSSNIISGNNISNNYEGIALDGSSNSIVGNNITDNMFGIQLLWDSINNSVCHNNFVDNAQQAASESTNLWDNGCEGNYWSDYNGTDSDFDGIGDTPYIIDTNNTDHCPLMNRYWVPADVNHDLIVNIFDAVRICAAYDTIPSDPEWNPHADIAEPFGKIDILDIVLCTSHYGEQYP